MKKLFPVVLLFIIACSIFSPSNTAAGDTSPKADELILYRLDDNYRLCLEGKLPVSPAQTIPQKMKALLAAISRRYYSDRDPIELLTTNQTKDGLVVTINLKESEQDFSKSRWYQDFQGSLGSRQTYFRVVYTALQPDYPNPWVAGMKVFWNGKPFSREAKDDLDFGRLTGLSYRRDMKKICSGAGAECL